MCRSHATVRGMLGQLVAEGDKVTITDLDAGLEHLSRGTASHVDAMLIVLEPYYKSLETGRRTHGLASELGIPRLYAVANKVRTPDDKETVETFCQNHQLDLLATIPYDENISEADRQGRSPLDCDPDSVGVSAIARLGKVLVGGLE